MKIMGIDPSINSTGICINIDNKKFKYYVISHQGNYTKKFLKELEENPPKDIIYKFYEKTKAEGDYATKEKFKTNNLIQIADTIYNIIKKEKPDVVYMEGISYGSGSSSALADLAGLNFLMRYKVAEYFKGTSELNIISPKELKSKACANGNATKEEMIYLWLKCDKKMEKHKHLKVDDLADAYFLTQL